MKILMLVPYLPNNETSGGQTRWFNIIRYLAKQHDITLFSLIKDDSEKRFIPDLNKYCRKVRVFRRSKKPWTLRNILLSVFGPYPLLVVRNWSLEEKIAIKKELEKEKYDLIHAETFYVMPHLSKTDVPTILVEQTIWHEVYLHHVFHNVPVLMKPFYFWDILKVKYWEKYYWKKTDRLVAVSEDDKKEMQKLVGSKRVGIIPNGVDSKYYKDISVKKISPPRILYGVTNFEWLQNEEATDVLVKYVWPKIKEKFPKSKIWVVGRKMPEWLKSLPEKDSNIIITENIPDARKAYGAATIMVAPIKGAGGTRLKILEAMAIGLPVVSTSIGVAGLRIENGVHAIVSDTYEGLAEGAVKLLKNPELARKIGLNGQKHVEKNYDWSKVVQLHDPLYESVLK